MEHKRLTVTVVGAGIAGLTAAIALRRAHHVVTIYEKSSLSHEIGQGIAISPNGGQVLKHLGLDFRKARMCSSKGVAIVEADSLRHLTPPQNQEHFEQLYGLTSYTAYRIDLHAALVELARSSDGEGPPVELHDRVGAVDFDPDSGVVVLETGQRVVADLIVAADGIYSNAAEHVYTASKCPALDASDSFVYRFTLPTEDVLSNPVTAPLLEAGEGWNSFCVSPDKKTWLLRYYCRDYEIQNMALYVLRTLDGNEKQEHRFRSTADKSSLLQELNGLHPALIRGAEMAGELLPLWHCTTREPLASLSRGKMVVIGDAAHPVLPHLGQGAVMAIEDAGALGVLTSNLEQYDDLDLEVQERLRLFTQLRVGRLAAVKYWSDVPWFRNGVEEQREQVRRFVEPQHMPGES